ncbi:hypothetical protein DSO57_1023684 [Entomophthora muscae]|uniref:Uncharacterized protein n=1 Tax=Entomophthora muscae TaxID=34485 RepID=A0ACC2T2P4_9FUNG|nr:hypothetical protein DSO57_1023684 [Entomophthora muscae]
METLKKESPEHYATLLRVPVTFQYSNDGHHLEYRQSTIFEDQLGQHHLFYSPPFMGPLDIHKLPAGEVAKFYSGFWSLAQIINRSDQVYKTRLFPGDLVLFNNCCVLHGQTAFYPLNRMRHFKGTYVGMNSFKDCLHTML